MSLRGAIRPRGVPDDKAPCPIGLASEAGVAQQDGQRLVGAVRSPNACGSLSPHCSRIVRDRDPGRTAKLIQSRAQPSRRDIIGLHRLVRLHGRGR